MMQSANKAPGKKPHNIPGSAPSMPRRLGWLSGAVLMGLCFSACTILGGRSGTRADVVERSREQAPAWIEQSPGQLRVAATGYHYVEQGTDLLDLPLGIKKTQLAALANSKAALLISLRLKLTELAKSDNIPIEAANEELEGLLTQTVESAEGGLLKTSDIFFERLQVDATATGDLSRTHFRVFVLVSLPSSEVGELRVSLSERLKAARGKDLRRLGQVLASYQKELLPP